MGYSVEEEWQKREESRRTCERTGWATRLRKSGKKEKSRGGRVSVLGGTSFLVKMKRVFLDVLTCM